MNIEGISEVLKEEVLKNHPEIAIIAIYGSASRGQQNEFSDIDMYCVLDHEDKKFEIHFTIEDQTVEFWCISWEWVEKIVTAESGYGAINFPVSADIFVSNKIIYARSEEDRTRFEKLSELAINISETKQIEIATGHYYQLLNFAEKINDAEESSDLLTARWAAWNFINGTVCVLGLLNNKRFRKNWGSNLHEAFEFGTIPDFYREDISILATSKDYEKMINAGKRILIQLREFIQLKRDNIPFKYDQHIKDLPDEYMGVKSYLNKILSASHKEDILAASYAATELQIWLAELLEKTERRRNLNVYSFNTYDELKETYEKLKLPDLTQSITKKDFKKLKEDCKTIDKIVVDFLTEKSLDLKVFDDINQIRKYARTK